MSYIDNYNKENYKQYSFRVRKDNKEVIEHLQSQSSISAYLLDLILKDIKKTTD